MKRIKRTMMGFDIVKSSLVALVCLFSLAAMGQNKITSNTRINTILEDGIVYSVVGNVSMTATEAGQSALQVAQGARAVIKIPAGATLTLKGADATDNTSGMPGILVPKNSTLVLIGDGTLVTTGGNGTSGKDGGDGENAGGVENPELKTANDKSNYFEVAFQTNTYYGGAGGAGGNGGNGAAPGIGGAGGFGGIGGEATPKGSLATYSYAGADGNDGVKTSASGDMGKVYVLGNVKVTAVSGNPGAKDGVAGHNGYYATTTREKTSILTSTRFVCFGGGGGGGGGGRGEAPQYTIGAGGIGGQGAGGGGRGGADFLSSGRVLFEINTPEYGINTSVSSGAGAGVGTNGTAASNKDNGSIQYRRTWLSGKTTAFSLTGGNGGNLSPKSETGSNGELYILGIQGKDKRINGSSAKPTENTTYLQSVPDDIRQLYEVVIKFDNQGGSAPIADITLGKDEVLSTLGTFTAPTKDGYYFEGYYTMPEGGEKMYDHDGRAVEERTMFASDRTLYAHWLDTRYTVVWDYSYVDQDGTIKLGTSDKSHFARVNLADNRRTVNAGTETDGTGDFAGHRVATSTAILNVGTNGWVEEDLYVGIKEAVALTEDGQIAPKYHTAYKSSHEVVLSVIPDGTYMQDWSIQIANSVKPSAITIKLLRADSENGKYEIIGQHEKIAVSCKNNDGVYTGEYPVWPTNLLDGQQLYYKVQVVGYEIDGKLYSVASLPLSEAVSHAVGEGENLTASATLAQSVTLPIVHLNKENDIANYSEGTPEYIYAEQFGQEIQLSGYSAEAQGYRFEGWAQTKNSQNTVTSVVANGDIQLYAQWSDAVPPVISLLGTAFRKETLPDLSVRGSLDIFVGIKDNLDGFNTRQWYYVSEDGDIDPSTITEWTEQSAESDGNYTINIAEHTAPYGYVYIKAQDQHGNATYLRSDKFKVDNQAPQIDYSPQGKVEDVLTVVCSEPQDSQHRRVSVSVNDNVGVASVKINGVTAAVNNSSNEKTITTGVTAANGMFYLAPPTEAEVNPTDEDSEPVIYHTYVITATDIAGNSFTRTISVYYQHEWETEGDDTSTNQDNDPNFTYKVTPATEPTADTPGMLPHINCKHCSRYILVNENGTNKKYDLNDPTDLEKVTLPIGCVLVKNDVDIFYGAATINEALNKAKNTYNDANDLGLATTIKLTPNTVGAKVDNNNAEATLVNPGRSLILDLNGQSIDFNGVAYENVSGNSNVTILLTDDGKTPYANKSKVNGSPIKYTRTFSSVQSGNWQAICLPFQLSTTGNFELAEYSSTASFEAESNGEAVIRVRPTSVADAFKPLFIKGSGATVINSSSSLEATRSYAEMSQNGTGLTMYGTLKDSPVSESGQPFWVMLNNGTIWYAKAGQTQRPYRWVIQPVSTTSQSFSLTLDQDDLTGIEENQTQTRPTVIYTIGGQRIESLDNAQPGVYIVNGKKVVVK